MAINTSKKLMLRVITPSKVAFEGEVDMAVLSTVDGEIGVLVGHEPLATILGLGTLRYYNDEIKEYYTVFGGFAEINQEGVTVLADIAEHPSEIDAQRAKLAKERAERRLSERNAGLDEKRAKTSIRKALVRLEISSQYTTTKK